MEKWQPNTMYKAGDVLILPEGTTYLVTKDETSGELHPRDPEVLEKQVAAIWREWRDWQKSVFAGSGSCKNAPLGKPNSLTATEYKIIHMCLLEELNERG